MDAIDVLANAIRVNSSPPKMAAGVLAERYLQALHAAGYVISKRDKKMEDDESH